MIDQEAIDMLSQSVAGQVHRDTGILVGHVGQLDAVGQRVVFTFKLGVDKYSYPIVTISELQRAHSWQGIFETLVRQVLEDTAPWALARKIAMSKVAGEREPEIPVVIDQRGKRHFRLKAETGYLFSAKPESAS